MTFYKEYNTKTQLKNTKNICCFLKVRISDRTLCAVECSLPPSLFTTHFHDPQDLSLRPHAYPSHGGMGALEGEGGCIGWEGKCFGEGRVGA